MDFKILIDTYPIVQELVKRTPQLKGWLERRAKEEDPALFAFLEMLQSREELRKGITELRDELRKGIDGIKNEL